MRSNKIVIAKKPLTNLYEMNSNKDCQQCSTTSDNTSLVINKPLTCTQCRRLSLSCCYDNAWIQTLFVTYARNWCRQLSKVSKGEAHGIQSNINTCTVKSRYLELGYLEFCDTRSVYLNQKYILIAFFNHNLALQTFLQVQITRSAN